MAGQLNQLPTSLEQIGSIQLGNKPVPVQVSNVWYKFFSSLDVLLQNIVNGVLAFTLDNNVAAAGATQATATQLDSEWNVISVVALNSGVKLQDVGGGVPTTVFNWGGNTLRIYPPVGGRIDGMAINAPYTLAVTKMQVFYQTTPTQWFSTQLG